jgi:hypothetical protein
MSVRSIVILSCSIILLYGCSIEGVYVAEGYRSFAPAVPADSIVHTVFLIGDAGEPVSEGFEPTFRALTDHASRRPNRSTIIFLGDNIYPRGLPERGASDRKEMERRLCEQIGIAEKSGADALFIPGNHDWEYQRENGFAAIRREEEFIRSLHLPNVRMLPRNGSPGPAVLDVNDRLRIIAIDTQWWLHQFEKPFYPNDSTAEMTKSRFLDSLGTSIRSSEKRNVLVVAHHPLETHGEHGGFFEWSDHIFPLQKLVPWLWLPLPGIGSLYPVSRMLGISDQDLSGAGNMEMRRRLDSVFTEAPILAYVAGHEHALQVLSGKSKGLNIVSGKGIVKHTEALTTGWNTIAATRNTGFQRMDILLDGRIRLGMIDCSSGIAEEVFSMWMQR